MTDLEKTRNLFKEMGANLKETSENNTIELSTYEAEPNDDVVLNMRYLNCNFECSIFFNKEGKFLGMAGFE